MHPTQYEDYKSGIAKERFLKDLDKRRSAKSEPISSPSTPAPSADLNPTVMDIEVEGQTYRVNVSYPDRPGGQDTYSLHHLLLMGRRLVVLRFRMDLQMAKQLILTVL